MTRAIAGLAALLMLSGCGTTFHDMLYYDPVDARASADYPPPAATQESAPSSYAPPPATAAPPPRSEAASSPPPSDSETSVATLPPPPSSAQEPPRALPEGSEPQVPLAAVSPPPPSPPDAETRMTPLQAAPAPNSDAHCRSIAQQRASDSAMNGFDDDDQKSVYDGTYADCMHWAAMHAN